MKETKQAIMDGVEHVSSKIVGNNTVEYMRANGERVVRLHHTDIITFMVNGDMVLNSGGWRTPTTKDRINNHQDRVRIWQKNREWFFDNGDRFADGVIITKRGRIKGAGKEPDKKLVAEIDRYSKAFADALPVEPPSAGDCWGCLMRDQATGKPVFHNDHLLEHLKENYFVPSLLASVLKEHGVEPGKMGGQAWAYAAFGKDEFGLLKSNGRGQFKRWIKNYLVARLVEGREG